MKYQYTDDLTHDQLFMMIYEQIGSASTITATEYNSETKRADKIKYLMVGAGFDCETTKVETGNEKIPFIAFVYHWQFGIHNMAFLGRSCESHLVFIETLLEVLRVFDKGVKLLVGDANLGYEWQFFKKYWAKFHITKIFVKEKRDPLMIELGNRIVFREVLGLFGSSLAQIAKNYCGIPKLVGDLDFDVIRVSSTPMDETEIGYCVRDVEILIILFEKHVFLNFYGDNPKLPYTKTGIVRDEIKRRLGRVLKCERDKIAGWMPDNKDVYEAFRLYLFKGGISGSNIIHMNKTFYLSDGNPIMGADITSDYPFQILTKRFPMGKAERCSNKEFRSTSNPYIALCRFTIFKARTSHALMSAHKVLNSKEMMNSDGTVLDNNRIQRADSVELLINDVEYVSLKRAYSWESCKIIACWTFPDGYKKLPSHITQTTIDWYKKKQKLKAEGKDGTLDYKEAKEFVNSIYGMMCTALNLQDYIFDIDEEEIEESEPKEYSEAIKHLFLSPYWGFWITSYARAMLMDVICRFPRVIIQYDTDSVYFIDDGSLESIRLKEYLEKRNKQMMDYNRARFRDEHMVTIGTWDFTQRFIRFKSLGSKRYMYEYVGKDGKNHIKVVIAGCRKSKTDGESTLIHQADYDGITDYFDFFQDRMHIDKEHAEKLRSIYIDIPVTVKVTDDYGNCEEIYVPSCVVLEPVDFTLGLATPHKDLWVAVERYYKNSTNQAIGDLWREHVGITSNVKKKGRVKECSKDQKYDTLITTLT